MSDSPNDASPFDESGRAGFGRRDGADGIVSCSRAGVITTSQLSMRASLAEAGASKTPSPNYQDTLTVTITPLDVASSPQDCAAL